MAGLSCMLIWVTLAARERGGAGMSIGSGKFIERIGGFAGLIALFSASSLEAAKPTILPPISPWNVDWSETTCSLRRAFGSKDDPSILTIERFGPTPSFQLSIISNEFKSFQQGGAVQLKFGDNKPRRITTVSPGRSGASGKAILFFGSQSLAQPIETDDEDWDPPVTPATEAAVKSISVSYFGHERVFVTGPMDKPFAALSTCTDDLVKFWGLDPKQQATLTQRPKPLASPATWIKSADYPAAMLTGGKQALVSFRLSVDARGIPTACEIQRSYNDKKFDDVTCTLLVRRARFSPALDAAGQAIASYYLSTVRWVMMF
jgi:hypothetical protein